VAIGHRPAALGPAEAGRPSPGNPRKAFDPHRRAGGHEPILIYPGSRAPRPRALAVPPGPRRPRSPDATSPGHSQQRPNPDAKRSTKDKRVRAQLSSRFRADRLFPATPRPQRTQHIRNSDIGFFVIFQGGAGALPISGRRCPALQAIAGFARDRFKGPSPLGFFRGRRTLAITRAAKAAGFKGSDRGPSSAERGNPGLFNAIVNNRLCVRHRPTCRQHHPTQIPPQPHKKQKGKKETRPQKEDNKKKTKI